MIMEETQTHIPMKSSNFVDNIANEYVEYLEIDSNKEQEKFSETVEEMLTKLDEFCTLVDMVRGDTTICLSGTLPKIQAKCEEMRKTFQKIDQLEEFVAVVRDNVSVMEEYVSKAEDRMGSFSGLKKMLSSFVSSKKPNIRDEKLPKYEPPAIFKTSEYITVNSMHKDSVIENSCTQRTPENESETSKDT